MILNELLFFYCNLSNSKFFIDRVMDKEMAVALTGDRIMQAMDSNKV